MSVVTIHCDTTIVEIDEELHIHAECGEYNCYVMSMHRGTKKEAVPEQFVFDNADQLVDVADALQRYVKHKGLRKELPEG